MEVPKLYQKLYSRAQGGKSLRAAINTMCLQCHGMEDSPQKAIHECSATDCALWAVRPYRTRASAIVDDKGGKRDIDTYSDRIAGRKAERQADGQQRVELV